MKDWTGGKASVFKTLGAVSTSEICPAPHEGSNTL